MSTAEDWAAALARNQQRDAEREARNAAALARLQEAEARYGPAGAADYLFRGGAGEGRGGTESTDARDRRLAAEAKAAEDARRAAEVATVPMPTTTKNLKIEPTNKGGFKSWFFGDNRPSSGTVGISVSSKDVTNFGLKDTRQPYWKTVSQTPYTAAEEGQFSLPFTAGISQTSFPFLGTPRGVQETAMTNIEVGREIFGAELGARNEAFTISKEFEEDPTKFIGKPGFTEKRTKTFYEGQGLESETITYGLGEEYFKQQPSFMKYASYFGEGGMLNQDIFKTKLKEVKQEYWTNKNAWKGVVGDIVVAGGKFGVGFVEFPLKIISQLDGTFKESPSEIGWKGFGGKIGEFMQTPTTQASYYPIETAKQETVNLLMGKGFSFKNIAKETLGYGTELLLERPGTTMPIVTTVGITAIVGSSWLKNIKTFGLGTGTLETIKYFQPYRIAEGEYFSKITSSTNFDVRSFKQGDTRNVFSLSKEGDIFITSKEFTKNFGDESITFADSKIFRPSILIETGGVKVSSGTKIQDISSVVPGKGGFSASWIKQFSDFNLGMEGLQGSRGLGISKKNWEVSLYQGKGGEVFGFGELYPGKQPLIFEKSVSVSKPITDMTTEFMGGKQTAKGWKITKEGITPSVRGNIRFRGFELTMPGEEVSGDVPWKTIVGSPGTRGGKSYWEGGKGEEIGLGLKSSPSTKTISYLGSVVKTPTIKFKNAFGGTEGMPYLVTPVSKSAFWGTGQYERTGEYGGSLLIQRNINKQINIQNLMPTQFQMNKLGLETIGISEKFITPNLNILQMSNFIKPDLKQRQGNNLISTLSPKIIELIGFQTLSPIQTFQSPGLQLKAMQQQVQQQTFRSQTFEFGKPFIPLFPFGMPLFPFGMPSLGGWPIGTRARFKRKYRYQPGLAALGFRGTALEKAFTSAKIPKGYETGLITRTILKPTKQSRKIERKLFGSSKKGKRVLWK